MINNIMSRKNSLLEISKAYEQILNEMNIGIDSSAQNTLLKNTMKPYASENEEIQFAIPKKQSPEKMFNSAMKGDMESEKCPCDSGNCSEENNEDEYHECGCKGDCKCHEDSNLSMAKSETYKILNYAKDLMELLQKTDNIEAWMLAKLVNAADYLCSVRGVLEYEDYEHNVKQCVDDLSNNMKIVAHISDMLNGENEHVNEEVLKRAIFNLEILRSK
jgi:hypothetical protein